MNLIKGRRCQGRQSRYGCKVCSPCNRNNARDVEHNVLAVTEDRHKFRRLRKDDAVWWISFKQSREFNVHNSFDSYSNGHQAHVFLAPVKQNIDFECLNLWINFFTSQ
jgi:hypothetical protein